MSQPPKPHRPSYQDSVSLEALAERSDPIERLHAAHDAAERLLQAGRSSDPEVVARLLGAADEVGMPTLAEMWRDRPARSLPGALYRLYLVRAWVHADPDGAACEYAAGGGELDSASGAEVRRQADEILRQALTGDLAAALDRAALFCVIAAAGRADPARADELHRLGTDMAGCATLWRSGRLR